MEDSNAHEGAAGRPSNPDLLATRARVASALGTLQEMQKDSRFDTSTVAALQGTANLLAFVGSHSGANYAGVLTNLIDVLPDQTVQTYVELSVTMQRTRTAGRQGRRPP